MFTSRIGRTRIKDEPPDGARYRRARRRLGAVFTLALLSTGFALIAAPQPAQAQSAIDGQWTVAHGGTGLISLNRDGTYTSTCQAYSNYPDARCPAPSGTFLYSSGYVDFNGADGSTHSYRVSGLASSPDTITSTFGSRTYSPLVMKPGNYFTCTHWSGTGTSFTRWAISPLVEYDPASNLLYATGSHDLIGPKNIDTQVSLNETAPNYFQTRAPCSPPPAESTLRIDSVRDASVSSTAPGLWVPQATVTITDLTGAPVSGAAVRGDFGGDNSFS